MNALPVVRWLDLLLHFAALSLLALGDAITSAPDMLRYRVVEHGCWPPTTKAMNTS